MAKNETDKLYRAIGLMSGTSGDGVDATLLETDGLGIFHCRDGLTKSYDEDLRARILEAAQDDAPLGYLLRIEKELTIHHANTIRELLEQSGEKPRKIDVVGFHGHTVRHMPHDGVTLQIGDEALLAELAKIPIVTNFRRRDMAAGGQGAPLAAMFHQVLFKDETRPTVVLNIGGVANVTWLGDGDAIIAGDTGPGCGLLDEWAQEVAGLPHDRDGHLAKAGKVNQEVVQAALAADFFQRPLPKAADRYDFDHVDVSGMTPEDGAATLCAVTVQAVCLAIRGLSAMPKSVWVTGGGVHHPVMMEMLSEELPKVASVAECGLSPDTLEAECFAWLAVRHLRGLPLTMPQTTGCHQPTTGGVLIS